MLVEAARLGATPSGTDVDPLAVEIIRHELQPPNGVELSVLATELLLYLYEETAGLFCPTAKGWVPLHYFYLHVVRCPVCSKDTPLYKNLVITRDLSKDGCVVRDFGVVAFCPECFKIHGLKNCNAVELRCCGRRSKLGVGNFRAGKFNCPYCGNRATHAELMTGRAPRQLLAIEETKDGVRRRIRAPQRMDRELLVKARAYLEAEASSLCLPTAHFQTNRVDARPLSFGLTKPIELFTDRQLATFGKAFAWVSARDCEPQIRRALTLALSNALTTNNRLCSYATDYGRLAPLFSVRSYSLPWLSVELNPFHPTAGRGTLPRTFQRMARSTSTSTRRYVWSPKRRKPQANEMRFSRLAVAPTISCASATSPLNEIEQIDICLFDPPYFDYIAYSELSEFYRVWHQRSSLGGSPLLPGAHDPSGSFGSELGSCLAQVLKVLRANRPLAFTFHSSSLPAWEAIGLALDHNDLVATAVWPVLNDSHMGHHSADGNCEWDLIVVCRRKTECEQMQLRVCINDWAKKARPLKIRKADRASMRMALGVLGPRFGNPRRSW